MQLKLLALDRALLQVLLWARFWALQLQQLLVVVMIEMRVLELEHLLVQLVQVRVESVTKKILLTAA
jgi:hypothetical protein